MSEKNALFLHSGNLDNWNVYKKLAVVCDVTEIFINRYLPQCRTVDQMRQAARSGKQNVVEGFADHVVSFEICHKLLGIAKGSLRELKEDYKDYLRQHKLPIWEVSEYRVKAWGDYAKSDFEIADFSSKCENKRPEVVANVMLTILSQLDAVLAKIMKSLLEDFEHGGGTKEKLYQLRMRWRQNPGNKNP